MRILQVSTFDTAGGAEQIAQALFRGYRARGHGSYMAVGTRQSDDPAIVEIPNGPLRAPLGRAADAAQKMVARSHLPHVPALQAPLRHLAVLADRRRRSDWWQGIEDFNFPGTARLLQLLPEQPDIVHAHNLHGGYFDLRALAPLCHQVPVVLTLHDGWLLSGHCAHSFDCPRWLTGCGHCPDLSIYPAVRRDATAFNWQRKQAIYAASQLYVATPCAWLMDRVRRSMFQPALAGTRVIPNGVDLATFQPADKRAARAALGLPQEAFILLFVGHSTRSNRWKDYATMEAAIHRVAVQPGRGPLLFLCLGEQGATQQVGAATIRFAAHLREPLAVARYYQAADVYLHAAHVDTFPTTILEALACGVPVVATGVCGIPEQVMDGHTGFLLPAGDAEAMAERIQRLRDDEGQRSRMGTNAANTAQQRFNSQRMVGEYLTWYRQILAEWKSS